MSLLDALTSLASSAAAPAVASAPADASNPTNSTGFASPNAQTMAILNAPPDVPAHRHGLGNVLGRIGDALLVANGQQPIYANTIRNQKLGQELGNYLGSSDQALAQVFQTDPEVGLKLYEYKHPASEVPADLKEYAAYANMSGPDRAQYERFLELTHPGMNAPITLGANDQYLPGGQSIPTVNTPEEAMKYPPGTVVKRSSDGKMFTVPGGATASPSPTFPGR